MTPKMNSRFAQKTTSLAPKTAKNQLVILENYNCVKGTYENYGARPEPPLMEINEGRASYDMDKLFQTMNNYVDDKLDQSPLRKYDHYKTQ